MKKQILILTTAILSLTAFAQVPSYVPANGLVGYWPFTGDASDSSGNNLNGTVVDALLTADRNSVLSSAYDFDFASASFGTQNDEIYIPYNPLMNVNFISVSLWLYPRSYFWTGDAGNPNSTILNRFQYTYSNPSGGAWGISFNQTSVSGSIVGPTGGAGGAAAISNTPLTLNTWHHIVMTYDGTNVKLYVDGSLSGIQNHTAAMNIAGNSGISIGESNQANGYWTHTDGKIDDIGMWNRALTACEIQNLYSSQLNSTFVSAGIDESICNGDQVTLSASGSQNYSWNNGVVDGAPFSPTNTIEYIVTADSAGCQSADTLTVFVNQPTNSTLNETALDSFTLNGQTYNQSGTYTQVIPNAAGCDSTITLNLSLDFTVLQELENSFTISPNPATDELTITTNSLLNENYLLFDPQGRKVLSGTLTGSTTLLDLSKFARGNYLLQIGEKRTSLKLIKQ